MSKLPSTTERKVFYQYFGKSETASQSEIAKFLFSRGEALIDDSRKLKQDATFTTANAEYRRIINDTADVFVAAASFSTDKPQDANHLERSAKIFSFLEKHEEAGGTYLAAAQKLREVGKERDLEKALVDCQAALGEFEAAKQKASTGLSPLDEKIGQVKVEQAIIRAMQKALPKSAEQPNPPVPPSQQHKQ